MSKNIWDTVKEEIVTSEQTNNDKSVEYLKIKMAVLEAIPVEVDIAIVIAALAEVIKIMAAELWERGE